MSDTNLEQPISRILLTDIVAESDIQPRQDGLEETHVATLVDGGPDTWPPLVVVERNGAYVLIDGHHRLAAARRLELADIACEIRPDVADADLRAVAFALNAAHGKPLTLADRRAEAERLLRISGNLSNNELARRCGLSDKTVAVIRERLEATSDIPKSPKRIGADGKSRSATRRRTTASNTDATLAQSRSTEDRSRHAGTSGGGSKIDPSMGALLGIVDQLCRFLENHAGDELGSILATAALERWSDPDRLERAEAMRLLSEQLLTAADRLEQHDSAAPNTAEQEQAA